MLILDEPTSMLTPQAFAELEQALERAQGAGPRHRLHHPQAARGARARRPDLGPKPGPGGRRDRAERELGATPHDELASEIVRMMFGGETRDADRGRRAAGASSRSARAHDATSRTSRCSSSRDVAARRRRHRAWASRTSRFRLARSARSSASPGSTATASARWPRSIAGQRAGHRRSRSARRRATSPG